MMCSAKDSKKQNGLSLKTKIRTTGIQKQIKDIVVDSIVLSDDEKPVKVLKTKKFKVKDHIFLKVTFNDGTVLEVNPGHLATDEKKFKDLELGDIIDKRIVTKIEKFVYLYKYTYDILPDSETGNYYANGILLRSSLKRHAKEKDKE